MLYTDAVPSQKDSRFGHMEPGSGWSAGDNWNNKIYAREGDPTDIQTAASWDVLPQTPCVDVPDAKAIALGLGGGCAAATGSCSSTTWFPAHGSTVGALVRKLCPVSCHACDIAGLTATIHTYPKYNDEWELLEGSGPVHDAALVMNTIDDPTPDQGSGGDSPLYGLAKCDWIRHATPSEVVGSLCGGEVRGQFTWGTIFQAAAGSLECGRLLATNSATMDDYTSYTSVTSTRCPRGSDVDTLNHNPGWTKRLLIGGCMISSDALYSAQAEVHVPQACAVPADVSEKGCLFPTALNFDPTAKQSDRCTYPTIGCMDPTAYNYNSEATVAGTCVSKVSGCSIDQGLYDGAPSGTATFNGYGGKFAPGLSLPLLPYGIWGSTYSTNETTKFPYNAAATDPADCVVAIEGCMDSLAVNYDSKATVDTGNWCKYPIIGCMDHLYSANFEPTATVNSNCTGKVFGCTDSYAVNYNPAATGNDGTCKSTVIGCGHPMAVNYDSMVTSHDSSTCTWYSSPPPAPPLPPGITTTAYNEVEYEATFNMTIEEVTDIESDGTTKAQKWCAEVIADTSASDRSSCETYAGSVVIKVTLLFTSLTAASTASTNLNDPDWVQSNLNTNNYMGATLQDILESASASSGSNVITLATSGGYNYPPAPPPYEGPPMGGIIGGVLGGIAALVFIAGLVYFMRKRKTGSGKASVTPGE